MTGVVAASVVGVALLVFRCSRPLPQAESPAVCVRAQEYQRGTGYGTGFLVAPDRVVTALHVVFRTNAAMVDAGDAHYRVLGVVWEDELADIAVLKLAKSIRHVPVLATGTAPTAGATLAVWTLEHSRVPRVVTRESPWGPGNTSPLELVAPGPATDQPADTTIGPGDSGSAVVNESNELVGVAVAGSPSVTIAAPLVGYSRENEHECVPINELPARVTTAYPDARLYHSRSVDALAAKQHQRAIDDARTAIGLQPDFSPAWEALSAAYRDRKQYNAAAYCMQRMDEIHRCSASDAVLLAWLHLEDGCPGEAVAALLSRPASEWQTASFREELGVAALRSGDTELAIWALYAFRQLPNATVAGQYLGIALCRSDRCGEAIRVVESVLDETVPPDSVLVAVTECLIEEGSLQEAQLVMDWVQSLGPPSCWCLLKQTDLYLEQSMFEEARATVERAITCKVSPERVRRLGDALAGEGRLDEAIAQYSAFVVLAWQDPFGPRRLAELQVKAGRLNDALATLESGVARFPDNVLLLRDRTRVLWSLDRYAEAARAMLMLLAQPDAPRLFGAN
jgi:tetratricopeptide (TPR) repeat protein